MLRYRMLCHFVLYYVMICNFVICYVMLCFIMLCYDMLFHVMSCRVMFCYLRSKGLRSLLAIRQNKTGFVTSRVTSQVSLFNLSVHLIVRVSSARVSPSFEHMIYIHMEWWRYHTVDGSVLYL